MTASDGTLSASDTFTLDITPVNDAPVAVPVDLGSIAEDGSRLVTSAELLAGVSDVDGPPAIITALTLTSGSGTLVDNMDGTWTYTPAPDDDTAATFSYTASDGTASASSTATLDITPVNDAPVVAQPIPDQASPEDTAWLFTVPAGTFTDVDNGTLAYSATLGTGDPLPAWLSFDPNTATFSGTPPADFNGPLDLTVTASDGTLSASDTFTLDITPVNDAPVVAQPIPDQASPEDTAWLFTVPAGTFTDVDNGTLTYSATLGTGAPLPAWLSFDPNTATFSGTPPADFNGPLDLTVTASDGTLSASDTFTLDITPVNDAPVAVPVDLGSIAEDGARLVTSTELLAGVSDVDGPPAIITALALTSGSGTLVDNMDGTWTYTPAPDDDTAATFSYTASDGTASASSTATLDITPVNDAPVAVPVDLGSIAEDGSRLVTSAELLAGVSDVDGPPAIITALTLTGEQRRAGRQPGRHLDLHPGAGGRHRCDILLHSLGRHRIRVVYCDARHHPGQRRPGAGAADPGPVLARGQCVAVHRPGRYLHRRRQRHARLPVRRSAPAIRCRPGCRSIPTRQPFPARRRLTLTGRSIWR